MSEEFTPPKELPKELQPSPEMSERLKDMGARLNRKELRLSKALDEMAMAADDMPGLYWFSEVFASYIKPQSDIRKMEMRAVFVAAINVIDKGDLYNKTDAASVPEPPASPEPPQPT